jgi:hypothetical protein
MNFISNPFIDQNKSDVPGDLIRKTLLLGQRPKVAAKPISWATIAGGSDGSAGELEVLLFSQKGRPIFWMTYNDSSAWT